MLLELQSVSREFAMNDGRKLHAVNEVDLAIAPGEALGLVGESGCGKSTLGRLCARALDPTRGKVMFEGRDITRLPPAELRALRRSIQFIYQDPHSALNPRMTILRSVSEPLILHTDLRGARPAHAAELMEMVGLPAQFLSRYPHELSGARSSACASPAPSRSSPGCWCWTNPPRRWMYRCRRRSWASQGFAGALPAVLSVHLAQPGGDPRAVPARGGDVPGPHRRARPHRGGLRPAPPPLCAGADRRDPGARGAPAGAPHRAAGRHPSPIDLPRGCAFASRCPQAIAGRCDATQPGLHRDGAAREVRCHLYAPA